MILTSLRGKERSNVGPVSLAYQSAFYNNFDWAELWRMEPSHNPLGGYTRINSLI